MDLLILCETATADGKITNDEVRLLQKWLVRNQHSTLPAIEFLTTTVERIVADARITPQEREELHLALERVMPSSERSESRKRRVEFEYEQLRIAEERRQGRQEKAETLRRHCAEAADAKARKEQEEALKGERALIDLEFSVAGVTYEGRSSTVRRFAKEGENVFLLRDRANHYSANAIEVRLKGGQRIGYVPEAFACDWAPLFDAGYLHFAYIKFIYTPEWNPDLSVPVIEGGIFVPGSMFPGAVSEPEIIGGSPIAPDSPTRISVNDEARANPASIASGEPSKDPHRRRVLMAVAVLILLIAIAILLGDLDR